MSKKTRAELEAELRYIKRGNRTMAWVSVIKHFITCACFCIVAVCIYFSAEVLAGKNTSASIIINFIGNIATSQGLALATAAGGVTYGLFERARRRKDMERVHARTKRLEKDRDTRRSSSGLTPKGETNPTDKE